MFLQKSFVSNTMGAGIVFLFLLGSSANADDFSGDQGDVGYSDDAGYSGDFSYSEDVGGPQDAWDPNILDNPNAMPGLTAEQQKRLAEVEAAYDKLLGKPKLSEKVRKELEAIWSKGEENLTPADERRIAKLLGPIPKITPQQQKQLKVLDERYDRILGNYSR